MYIYNTDTQMWVKQTDTLSQDNYDNLKQDLSQLQLYSRDLSGATYLYTSNTASIYDSLKYKDNSTWVVSPLYSNWTSLPTDGSIIDPSSLNTYQNYSYEYGFSLKNFFTPLKTIDSLNTINVSVATTEQIDLNSSTFSQIDGIDLLNGNLVLVKDQLSTVDLDFTVNPDSYFDVNYYFVSTNIADITYEYYNSDNGIYIFQNGQLIKQDLMTYSLISQLSIYVQLGTTYQDSQFALSRKKNGFYPIKGEPFEFKSSKNYLVRNQVDYHNLFESNYYDILKHATQSLTIEGFTYTIPSRLLYVGDFGIILNLQQLSYSQYVWNPYKDNIRSITQTTNYYWMCGDNGNILRMSKLDFSIIKIDLGDEWRQLMSISFVNDLNGMVVGKNNCIYYTKDGGFNWTSLNIGQENWSYNRCLYYNYNLIFLAGENGLFVELTYSDLSGFNFEQINLVKNLSLTDTYDLIQDINDMYYTHFDTYQYGWGLTYATAVDLMAGNGITYSMDCLFMVTNNSNILCYEINNFVTEHDVLYLSFSQSLGDLTSITRQNGTNNMFVSGDNLYTFDINTFKYVSTTSNQIGGSSYSIVASTYSNRIFDFEGVDLYRACNFANIYDYNYTSSIETSIQTETVIPKMLFMEYDMADKLNFFDENFNYRLPNSVTFSGSTLSEIYFNNNQATWLDYLKDIWKVYPAVGADTSSGNEITLNTLFSIRNTSSITFSSSDITLNYNDISGLYPNVGSYITSRWNPFTPTVPSSGYSVFMNSYISVFKLPNDFCVPGDILMISASNINANLMVNYGLTTSALFTYFYAFNDFNTAILNSIKNSPSLSITNLNKFENASVLVSNFENHPISTGYNLTYDGNNLTVNPVFNNYTAYKSLEANLNVINGSTLTTNNLIYEDTFNLFGYTPKYSLLNYLSNINSTFTASKIFYSMPIYVGLPCNGASSFTSTNIYFDSNLPLPGTMSYAKNKLLFGSELKFQYDTLWLNTFVDLNLYTSAGNFTKTQVLITNKYYDSVYGGWALEFNDNIIKTDDGITHYRVALNSIDIISRNTLGQISADLEIFNNLNKPLIDKKFNSGLWNVNIYDNPIKTKINTDSYTKILLSDGDIKKYINSIIFTNSDNILTLNVVNIPYMEQITINDTFTDMGNLAITTDGLKDVNGTFLGYLNFTGGTGSSQQLNPSYIGINSVTKIDEYIAMINTEYLITPSVTDIGYLTTFIFDPFFNYSPVNLLEISNDMMFKIPTILSANNLLINGKTNSIVQNSTNPAFRLVDGLDINIIQNNYHWILEAEIEDAVIGINNNGIVWYSGIWYSGRWFGDTWYSGTWVSGDWYSGNWFSSQVIDNGDSIFIGNTNYNNYNSVWYNGRFFSGTWNSGSWINGRWYGDTWKSGLWFNGIWNNGIWESGIFYGGVWIEGNWYSGTFNSFNKPAYWLNGSFNSGDFQNGMWYNGIFGNNFNTLNKFGSLASNSRNAIWQGGVFSSGNFYSSENIVGGTISASPIHKYSQWKTGSFNSGNFYGGIVYNINISGSEWISGILMDIEIIGINLQTNIITLNGLFMFNIGDYVNMLANGTTTPYLQLGNYSNYGRYRVALIEYDYNNNWTFLTLNYDLSSLGVTGYYAGTASYNIDTGMRLVSKFNNIDWSSGIWYNGIFESGNFYGGMWYNGVFNGNWGI